MLLPGICTTAGCTGDKSPAQFQRHVFREYISWEFALWAITDDDVDWEEGMDAISTWLRDHPNDFQLGSCMMCLGPVWLAAKGSAV